MEKEKLYRFFEGETTLEEEQRIREWMERSEVNFHTFMRARKKYDILTLAASKAVIKEKKPLFTPWLSGVTAAAVLILIVGGLYLFGAKERMEQYNTIIVPPGQRINLILSDNTNLWLNANTRFRYPSDFSGDSRTVYLDGEAYFEVSKDKKKPFIVKTVQGDIFVTGTSFNVEAYSQYKNFETSLFEGGVEIYREEIKLASLQPNEKGVITDNQVTVTQISDTDKYLWRNGLIAFSDKKLEEILLTFEKYFAVKIQINTDQLPQHTYTGKFRQSDGVDYALKVLQRSIRFSYERDEETGIVYIK